MKLLDVAEYRDWLVDLKAKIRKAQTHAFAAVNSELVLLYWQIGKDILARQERQGWGAKVVDQLSADLRQEFPDMKGFSSRNLKYMRAFASAYRDPEFVQRVSAQMSWSHNCALLDKVSVHETREWYANAAIAHGWSLAILLHQIETKAHERQGVAVTNFQKTLPEHQSELAQQLTKDPYVLDFLMLKNDARERDLENALITHLQSFLLELGKGFAFIGRQYRLVVGGQEFYLDLLFYNAKLHCYVIIDLKMDDFKPEYVGKMQFYLAVVDEQLKSSRDEFSIGLILCKTKNGVIAEYALRDSSKPIGVSEYRVLPPEVAEVLPTIKQLEAELLDENQKNEHDSIP